MHDEWNLCIMVTMSDTTIPTWTLGDRLAKARDDAGISQLEMSRRLNVARNTVSNWENDHVAVTKATMIAYASITRAPLWWIEGTDPEDEATAITWYTAPLPLAA